MSLTMVFMLAAGVLFIWSAISGGTPLSHLAAAFNSVGPTKKKK